MSARNWLEELRAELALRKLPAAYVARLVDELSDHVTDFLEDQMSTDALPSGSVFDRLGAPQDVAGTAVSEFRRRTFSGRHPLLMFVAVPIVVLCVGFVASMFGVIGAGWLWKWFDPAMSSERLGPAAVGVVRMLCIAVLVVPAALTAALFSWLAGRATMPRKWPIITGALLGLLVGLAQLDVSLSTQPGKSQLMFGFGFGSSTAFFHLAKFVVPLAVGLWVFSRRPATEATSLPA